MVLLILESLGSTELFFILVMALVFFGPRKLPQLSRTLGKNLANFRRASEDFKRTWDREVNLEELNLITPDSHSIANNSNTEDTPGNSLQPPTIETVSPDRVIPRSPSTAERTPTPAIENAEPSRKSDWL